MSKFYCYFLGPVINESPLLDSYADYFLNYKSEKWRWGSSDGVFSFLSDSGDQCDLSVLESEKYGISVRYNIKKSGERRGGEFYSVNDLDKINDIEDVGDDQFALVGSFLKPQEAWLALEDFFNDPLHKSGRVKWINSNEIAWPDDW